MNRVGSLDGLSLPELPILLVSLMGISQVTYLTAKSVKPAFISINEIRPRRIRLKKANNLITILGIKLWESQRHSLGSNTILPLAMRRK